MSGGTPSFGATKERCGPLAITSAEFLVMSSNRRFIKVSFHVTYTRACKKVRAIIIGCAARNSAMYLAGEMKRDTMYWREDVLLVGLLFESLDNAREFQEELQKELQSHAQAVKLSQIASGTTAVDLVDPPERILEAHYEYFDYDYGECPFACEVDAIANILCAETPAAQLQHLMIERHDLAYFRKLYPYKAFLKGVAEFPDEGTNPNNMLVMSWNVRQFFDGLVTRGDNQVPLIAIRFVMNTKLRVTHASQGELERVIVAIESPDEELLLSVFFENSAKAGSRYDERTRSVFTFLDVPDAAEFERSLTYKYRHTKHAWRRQRPGMRLSPREAGELREAAHAAVMREIEQATSTAAATTAAPEAASMGH